MTETLRQALRRLAAIGGGYVRRNADGGPKTDGQTGCAIHRIYDRAGLEEHPWTLADAHRRSSTFLSSCAQKST